MDPVQKLLAIEEIKNVKAKYFRFVDAKLWDDYSALFAPGMTFDFEEIGQPTPLDQFVAFTAGFLEGSTSIHRGYCPEIEITSETTATAIWGFEDRIYWTEQKPGRGGLLSLQGDGHYYENYTKIGASWKISKQKVIRQRLRTTASELHLTV